MAAPRALFDEAGGGPAANAVSSLWGDFGGCMACLPGVSISDSRAMHGSCSHEEAGTRAGSLAQPLLKWLSERIV
jgi:hypothetical protein